VIAFVIIVLTIPDGFEHYGDMGTSATGVALSRSYYDQTLDKYTHAPGYIVNGSYNVYANWPSFGFKVLAGWYHLFGEDSIYNARLLPSLLYSLSALLFFVLLLRCDIDLGVSFISALLFSVLPYHLEFGKLIFSDMWLIPFWLLCLLIFTGNKRHHWIIIPIAIIGTIGFMWFVVFAIPSLIIYKFLYHFKLKAPQIGVLLVSLIGITLILQWISFSIFQGVPIVDHLEKWTLFGLEFNEKFVEYLIKRPITLIYEAFSTLLLAAFLIKSMSFTEVLRKGKEKEELIKVLTLALLVIFCFVIFLPKWPIVHAYGVGFFSILIAGCSALLLQVAKDSLQIHLSTTGTLMIACSLGMYFFYPVLSKGYKNEAVKTKKISNYINKHQTEFGTPTIFFDINDEEIDWHHSFRFGIKEETRSYIFQYGDILDISELPNKIDQGFNNLKKLGKQDFDKTYTYFVTDQKVSLQSVDVLDSLDLDDVHLYKIAL